MKNISHLTYLWLKEMDPELHKAATAARVKKAFSEAIIDVFPSERAAQYVLEHVQAVYVMRDDNPACKNRLDKPPILLRIYSDDSVVRAEIDARQEFIRMALAKRNITYDVCKIHASKMGMKKRPPLSELVRDDTPEIQDVERHDLTTQEIDTLVSKINDKNIANSFRKALEATRSLKLSARNSHQF